MFKYLKQTVRHSAVYSFNNILQKGVGFLMIPVYTHYLSPEEYGILELVDLTMLILSMMAGMKMGTALIRFFHKYDKIEEQREIYSTSLIGIVFLAIVVTIFLESFSGSISGLVLGEKGYDKLFQIVFVSMALQTILTIPENLLLAQKRPITLSIISFLSFSVALTFNILFIVVMRMGVLGMVVSTLITKVINTLLLLVVTKKNFYLSFCWDKMKGMIVFSLPLIPASLGMFVINYSDRLFIRMFCDMADLGVYSLGYKFGMMIPMLVSQPIYRIWNTQRFEISREEDSNIIFGRMFTYIFLIFVLSGLCISLFSKEIVSLMAPDSYRNASDIISLIVLGYVFFACSNFFELGMYINYQTKYVAYITISGAVLNAILNYFFISKYGIIGAAIATLITFSYLGMFNFIVSQKIYPVKYEYSRIMKIIFIALLVYCLSFFVQMPIFASLLVKCLLLILLPTGLFLWGFFKDEEIKKSVEMFRSLRLKIFHL